MSEVNKHQTRRARLLAALGARRKESAFALIMAVASGLGLLKGLIFAKTLGVRELGYFGVAVLVQQFGISVATLGTLSALNQVLPIAYGRDDDSAGDLASRSLIVIASSSVVSAVLALLLLAVIRPADPDLRLALGLAAFAAAATAIAEYFILVIRAQRKILVLAWMFLLRAVLAIILGTAASIVFGFAGVVVAEIVAIAVVVALIWSVWLRELRPSLPTRDDAVRLFRPGFPLMIANLAVVGTILADRAFVASVLPDEFGQYVLASLVVVAWLGIMAMINQVMAPRMLHDFGAGDSLRATERRAYRFAALVVAAGAVAYPPFLALTAALENFGFEEYGEGIRAMRILYLGGFFLVAAFPGFLLHAVRPSYSTMAAVAAAIVAVGGASLVTVLGPSLNAFAWVFVSTQAARAIAMALGLVALRRHPEAEQRARQGSPAPSPEAEPEAGGAGGAAS